MAKVASTLTLLSLLLAFTYASTPFDIPENDVTFLDLSTPLRENDVVKPKLLLPSEKPIDEPNTPKIADNQTPVQTKNDDVGVVAEEQDQKPVEGENRLVAEEEHQKPVGGKNNGVVAVEEDQNTVENKIHVVAAVKGKGFDDFDREMFHSASAQSAVHPRWMKHHHHGEHEGRPWFPFFGRHHHNDNDDHHHHRHDHHHDDHDHNHHHDNDDDDDDHDHDDDHNHHHDHHHDDNDHDDDHDHHHDDDDHDDDHDHHDHHGEHQRSIRRPFIRRDQVEEEKQERGGDGGFLDEILNFFDDLF